MRHDAGCVTAPLVTSTTKLSLRDPGGEHSTKLSIRW